MSSPELAPVKNYFFDLHGRVDFLRLREKLRDRLRLFDPRYREMRTELPGFGRKAGFDDSGLSLAGNPFQSFATFPDSYPHDARTSRIRECAEFVKLNVECSSEAGRIKIFDQLLTLSRIRIADEPQREMPVLQGGWFSREGWRHLPRECESRTFGDWNADEEAMLIVF